MKSCSIIVALLLGISAIAEDIDLRPYSERNPAEKSVELMAAENCFLWICDELGSTNKLTFSDMIGAMLPLASTEPVRFEALYKGANLCDAAGKRSSATWWDNIERHDEIPDASNTFIQATIALGGGHEE
jgi:hypothetical protein